MSNSYEEYIEKEKLKVSNIYYNKGTNINFDINLPNNGFDDSKHYYITNKNDNISFRYQIIKNIGKGVFGSVILALDHKYNSNKAIKIIRNESRFKKCTLQEIKILNIIRTKLMHMNT